MSGVFYQSKSKKVYKSNSEIMHIIPNRQIKKELAAPVARIAKINKKAKIKYLRTLKFKNSSFFIIKFFNLINEYCNPMLSEIPTTRGSEEKARDLFNAFPLIVQERTKFSLN